MKVLSEIEQLSLENELLDKKIQDLKSQIYTLKDAKKQICAQSETLCLKWMQEALNSRDLIKKLETDGIKTPNSSLPQIGCGPRKDIIITISVTEDFEKRLDNQWMVEREIHADRWMWKWAD